MRSLLLIFFLFPLIGNAGELSWTDIESRILGVNLDVQAQTNEVKAAEKESKATVSPFLPSVSVNAGTGRETRVSEDDRGTQVFVEGKWNLYRGGKDAALKEKAQVLARLAETNLDVTKRDTLFRAKELFYNLLSIKSSLEILDREDQLNKTQRGMAKKKVSAGLTSNVDEIEFDLRADFISAERSKLLSEQDQEISNLRALLNINDSDFAINGSLAVPKRKEIKAVDLTRSPISLSSSLELKVAEADKNVARSGFLPELNLVAAYGRQTLQRDDPIKNDETTAILSLSLPIFTGFETFNLTKAQSERVSAREKQLRQTQNNLRATEQNLRSRWKETWALYELNEKTLERAKKYYELTLGEYRRGIKNSPDIVSATERLFDAEMKAVSLTKELILIEAEADKTF